MTYIAWGKLMQYRQFDPGSSSGCAHRSKLVNPLSPVACEWSQRVFFPCRNGEGIPPQRVRLQHKAARAYLCTCSLSLFLWKKPPRSSPAFGQTPLCQQNWGSKCHIQLFLVLLWWMLGCLAHPWSLFVQKRSFKSNTGMPLHHFVLCMPHTLSIVEGKKSSLN